MDFRELIMCFNISNPAIITYTVIRSDGTLEQYNNIDVPTEILNFIEIGYIPTACNTVRYNGDLYMLMNYKK